TAPAAQGGPMAELVVPEVDVEGRTEGMIAERADVAARALAMAGLVLRGLAALVARHEGALVRHDQVQQVGLLPGPEQLRDEPGRAPVDAQAARETARELQLRHLDAHDVLRTPVVVAAVAGASDDDRLL